MGGAAADDGSLPLCARINCHALVVGTCFVAFVMIAVCGAAAYYLRMHAIRAREALDLEAVDGAQTSRAHTAQYCALVKSVRISPRTHCTVVPCPRHCGGGHMHSARECCALPRVQACAVCAQARRHTQRLLTCVLTAAAFSAMCDGFPCGLSSAWARHYRDCCRMLVRAQHCSAAVWHIAA